MIVHASRRCQRIQGSCKWGNRHAAHTLIFSEQKNGTLVPCIQAGTVLLFNRGFST
jgi:hypothetical protein